MSKQQRLVQIIVSVDMMLPEDRLPDFDAKSFEREFGYMVDEHYTSHPRYPTAVRATKGIFTVEVETA